MVIHLPVGLTTEDTEEFVCHVDIDNDVVISTDRRWRRRWDLSRLCWDTGCGIWQKWVGRRHGYWLKRRPELQADISTASFSDAVQSSCTLRAYLEANGCLEWLQLTVGVCIGEKGSALMVHGGVRTLRLNAQFTEGWSRTLNRIRLYLTLV